MEEKVRKRYGEEVREIFSGPAPELARWLLGKNLCRKRPDGRIVRLTITETEAYGHDDPACYGYGGKKTQANAPLFERGGICCVYGEMLLVACGEKGEPDNVLIRRAGYESTYCGGPILVCEELGLGKADSGIDLLTSDTLWLEGIDEIREYCQIQRICVGKGQRNKALRFITL